MHLTRKLIIATTCAILVVLGINALVRVQREVALFEDDIRRDSRLLGRTLAGAVSRVWSTVGEAEALDLVEDADQREGHVSIHWRWLDQPGALSADARARLADGGEVVYERSAPGGGDFLHTYIPVSGPGERVGVLELRESLASEQRYVRRTILQAIVTTAVLVLVCGLVATALGVLFVGRPVRRLVEHARRIGTGDLSAVAASRQRDEIGELGREMNAMCERLLSARTTLEDETARRLATQEQLRHADRLNTVGKLAAGIAHELGTPLNVITGHAGLIREDVPDDHVAQEHAAIIIEQAHRVANIVRQLLDFARQHTLHKGRHEVGPVAAQVIELLEPLARKRDITLELAPVEDAIVAEIDAQRIQQVLTNLVVNAIHAMAGAGRVLVEVARVRATPPEGERAGDFARISVTDAGSGIEPADLPRIFEPFFTTKGVGEGTGLGLSVAHGIVKEHSGWIEADSELGKGTCFAVYLPL